MRALARALMIAMLVMAQLSKMALAKAWSATRTTIATAGMGIQHSLETQQLNAPAEEEMSQEPSNMPEPGDLTHSFDAVRNRPTTSNTPAPAANVGTSATRKRNVSRTLSS